MSAENMDLGAVIASLEAKRAALDNAIAALRAVAASGALGPSPDGTIGGTLSPFSGSGGGEVPDGAFHGKSMPAAIRLYLEIMRGKKTAREISDGLKKGGLESTSKFFDKIVYATLDRLRKAGEVVKIGTAWGLPSWYPALMRAGAGDNAEHKKPRRGRPRKSGPNGAPKQKNSSPGAMSRIAQVLRSKPGAEFSAEDLATAANLSLRVTRLMLGRLVAQKAAEKTPGGKYKAAAA